MEDGSAMVSAYLQGQWSRIGNGTGLGGATPTPFLSQLYKTISHPCPIPGAGRVNGIPSPYLPGRGGVGSRDQFQHSMRFWFFEGNSGILVELVQD